MLGAHHCACTNLIIMIWLIGLLLLSCVFEMCASMVAVPSVFRNETDFAFAQAGVLHAVVIQV